jgi:hypothetical protein
MTTQKTLLATTLGAAFIIGIYAALHLADLRNEVEALRQQQSPLSRQLEQMRHERDEAASRSAALQHENDDLRRALQELPRLRGENARLRSDSQVVAESKPVGAAVSENSTLDGTLKPWAARAASLKQKLAQMPDKQIPELKLLKEQDWFDATKNANLDTEDGIRQSMRNLRNQAKLDFDHLLQGALRGYAQDSGGQLPSDLAQLKPYFQTPVDDEILQRYKLLQTGQLSDAGGDFVVAETAPPVDNEFDTIHQISIGGISVNNVHLTDDLVAAAATAFAQANNGLLPHDASQLTPYLKQQVDPARAQTILSQIPPNATLDQLRAAGGMR